MFWAIAGALGAQLVGGAIDDTYKENEVQRQRQVTAEQHMQQMELNKSAQKHETVMGIINCVNTLITVAGNSNR